MFMNLKDKILKYGSFALVFLAPLVFFNSYLYPYISSKTFFIYGVVEILFFIWIYSISIDPSYRMPKKAYLWLLPFLVFVGWMTIAGLLGLNFSLSFWSSLARGTGLLTLYHCTVLLFVITSVVYKNGFSYARDLMKWAIYGGTILIISIWMGNGGLNLPIKILREGGEGGLMGNSSLAAVYLIFILFFALFLLAQKNISKKQKWYYALASAAIVFSPLLINVSGFFNSYSVLGSARASVLALGVMLGVFISLYFLFSSRKSLRIAGGVLLFVGVVAFTYGWMQLVNPTTTIHAKFEEQARGSRFIFWDIAQNALNQSPVIGYGPETYPIVFQKNFNPDILLSKNSMEGWSDRTHNVYYEMGISGGYGAIVLYATFLGSILFALYRLHRKGVLNRTQVSLLGTLVVGYLFQNLFIFDSPLSLMMIVLVASFAFALNIKEQKNTSVIKRNDILAGILLIAFIGSYIGFVYMPIQKSKLYAKTFSVFISQNTKDYTRLLAGSPVGEAWDASTLAYDAYRLYLGNIGQFKSDPKILQNGVSNIDALLSYLYSVSDRNTTDFRLYLSIVYLENTKTYLTNRPYDPVVGAKLIALMEKAKSLAPTNPNVYWNIAQVKLWAGDFKGVEEAFREATIVAPHLPGAYSLFLKYAIALQNKKLFDEILAEAQKNIPGFTLQ
jgi:O-antigen ligase